MRINYLQKALQEARDKIIEAEQMGNISRSYDV